MVPYVTLWWDIRYYKELGAAQHSNHIKMVSNWFRAKLIECVLIAFHIFIFR